MDQTKPHVSPPRYPNPEGDRARRVRSIGSAALYRRVRSRPLNNRTMITEAENARRMQKGIEDEDNKVLRELEEEEASAHILSGTRSQRCACTCMLVLV